MAEPEKKPDSPPAAPATAARTATPAATPAAPAAGAATAAPAKKPTPPTFQIYNRQKDQHVVGPGCWCLPKIEVVNGQKVIVHKRD